MAGDGDNTKSGGSKLPHDKKSKALETVVREFEGMGSVSGAGLSGGDKFGDALRSKSEAAPEGPGGARGLDTMTQNIKFAEKLVEEKQDLDIGTRALLEGMLGRRLEGINVYAGRFADAASRALGADAFAVGKHVFFRQGKFTSGSTEGLALMAHEFTHTFQGDGGMSKEDKESEAHAVEDTVAGSIRSGSALPGVELALDQAPATGLLDSLRSFTKESAPGSPPKPDDQDFDPAPTHDSPDEKEVVRQLLERVVEQFKRESDLDLERDGYGY